MTRRKQRCGLGLLAPEEQAAITAAVRAYMETLCRAESTVPLPAIAARAGREHYTCGREKGHPPPHRWPKDGSIAEWTD